MEEAGVPRERGVSLRMRLFLVLLAVNLALLASVQLSSWQLQQDWLEQKRTYYESRIYEDTLKFAYSDYVGSVDSAAVDVVRRVLSPELRDRFRSYFQDVLVTSGSSAQAAVDLNPLGAAHRSQGFPLQEIRNGIHDAMEERRLVRAGGGFCVAIVAEDRVVGGAWFSPRLPPPPQLPFSVFAIPVLLGTVLFGAVLFWFVGRRLVRPLLDFGSTARRFGAGDYSARMPRVDVPELAQLLNAFNAMAERIAGHHAELAREVEQATEDAKRQERALLQSSRLASMGTLAAGIAHEINNPIGGMRNAIRRIGRNPGLDDRDRVYIELIEEGLDRVARIARRVLDFSPSGTEAVPFEISSAVDGAWALVEHRSRRSEVVFEVALEPELPRPVGDRHEFQQVLLNLFINSLDVLEERPAGRISVRGRRLGDREIEVVVADDGPGMPSSQLERVVDPFFTAKGRPDASGLGLFISDSIVRNMGGTMAFESEPGAGFLVRITLPAEVAIRSD